mmetsp:Transcript_72422/g.228284  ORF Transcript_72422/g.228284 Transcript_72422/m.228284 type:complete len:304 (-) Transcript_72422:441-1352(-)
MPLPYIRGAREERRGALYHLNGGGLLLCGREDLVQRHLPVPPRVHRRPRRRRLLGRHGSARGAARSVLRRRLVPVVRVGELHLEAVLLLGVLGKPHPAVELLLQPLQPLHDLLPLAVLHGGRALAHDAPEPAHFDPDCNDHQLVELPLLELAPPRCLHHDGGGHLPLLVAGDKVKMDHVLCPPDVAARDHPPHVGILGDALGRARDVKVEPCAVLPRPTPRADGAQPPRALPLLGMIHAQVVVQVGLAHVVHREPPQPPPQHQLLLRVQLLVADLVDVLHIHQAGAEQDHHVHAGWRPRVRAE